MAPSGQSNLARGSINLSGLLLLVLVCISYLSSFVAGDGTCVPYDGSNPSCSLIIPEGTPIFVPEGRQASDYFGRVTRILFSISLFYVPPACLARLISITCTSALRPCVKDVNGAVLPWPTEPCRKEVCEDFKQACNASFGGSNFQTVVVRPFTNNSIPLTCDEIDTAAQNVSLFSNGTTTYNINGTLMDFPCANGSAAPDYIACHEPTVRADGKCEFTCPLPSLDDDQYQSAKIMQGVVGWFSWAGSAFLVLSYLVNPRLRSFPHHLIMMTAAAANILAGGIVLPTYAGHNQIWCGGQDETIDAKVTATPTATGVVVKVDYSLSDLTVHSSGCSFQGALILYGFLSATYWWMIIAFNMCLEMLFRSWLLERERLMKYIRITLYNILGWCIPGLLMIIPTSADRMGFVPGATFCFPTEEDDKAWSIVFFFIPVGLNLVFGLILFFVAIVSLLVSAIRVRKYVQIIMPHIRLFLFVLTYFTIFAVFIAYVITEAANADTISDGYSKYYQCLTGATFTPVNQCSLSDDVTNYPLVMLRGFAISCLGIMLFFIFLSWALVQHWYSLFKALFMLAWKRRRLEWAALLVLLAGKTVVTSTITSDMAGSQLSVVNDEGEEDEDEEEEEEEGEGKDDVSNESSSSEVSSSESN